MSVVSNQLRQSGSIIGALDAVSNVRAVAVNLGGFVAAALISVLLALILGVLFVVVLLPIATIVVGGIAFNAAGIMLMDQVQGGGQRAVSDALIAGAFAFAKGIAVGFLALLAMMGILLTVALLLVACKIPVIGPLLFVPVFPLAAILLGIALTAWMFLLAPVAMPAIWAGETIGTSLARVIVVAKQQLIGVVVRNIALSVLIVVAGMIVWGVVFSGVLVTGSLSLGILGVSPDMPSMNSMLSGYAGGDRFASYGVAGMVGGLLLVAVVMTLPVVMLQKGWCLIYREVVEGLDASGIEAEIQRRLAEVRQKAEAARQRVQQQDAAARQATPDSTDSPSAATASTTCPSCKVPVQADDVFCGNCGFKLR